MGCIHLAFTLGLFSLGGERVARERRESDQLDCSRDSDQLDRSLSRLLPQTLLPNAKGTHSSTSIACLLDQSRGKLPPHALSSSWPCVTQVYASGGRASGWNNAWVQTVSMEFVTARRRVPTLGRRKTAAHGVSSFMSHSQRPAHRPSPGESFFPSQCCRLGTGLCVPKGS